jgi:hypothetical protein
MLVMLKDPDAALFYGLDWSKWLAAGALIAESAWLVEGPDTTLTFDHASVVQGQTSTQLRLLGGTAGKLYTVTNRITTNEAVPQTDDRSFAVQVSER